MRIPGTLVRVAHAAVEGPGGVLVTLGLGSCVAILLHDPVARVAGMAHVLLARPRVGAPENPAKYATTAVPLLIREMEARGARCDRMVARLAGGATMFGHLLIQDGLHAGERNVAAARAALATAGIPVRGEEVGREHGRSVYFHADDGRVLVTSYQHGDVVL